MVVLLPAVLWEKEMKQHDHHRYCPYDDERRPV